MADVKELPLRKDVDPELTWDLTTVYQDDSQFEQDFNELEREASDVESLKGTLGESAGSLLTATERIYADFRKLEKAYVYSQLKNDQDTSDDKYQGMNARMGNLAAKLSSATSFFEPELLSVEENKINQFYDDEPKLKLYKRAFDQILSKRDHILSNEVESVLSLSSDIFSSGEKTFGLLNNTDLKFPVVEDENGEKMELSEGVYSVLLESKDQSVRKQAFQKLYEVYGQFQHTLASTLTTNVKTHNFNANLRHYDDALSAALSNNEIPSEVYTNLIKGVNDHLDLLHRYVNLRKKILGLDEMHMYDLYTSLVGDQSPRYTFEESKNISLDALKVLGDDYVSHVKEEFNGRWIDVVESKYKRSGGYSSGTYDTNPFILLNWKDNLDNLYTLIHETGHSMHSYYSHHNQPYVYGDYSIFVAEIASTTNENILTSYLLDDPNTDPELKKHILNYYLDGFKGTVFRQTQFAEFEQFIHEEDAKGVPLTANHLNEFYRQLNEKYYGDGVISDPEIALEWSRIPHFYYNYYVYQYSTGFAAASTLSDKILNGTQQDVDNYLGFLKAGSSDVPVEVMKRAGVDMTKPDYLNKAFAVFEKRLTQFEQLFENN
ncbi:oligoendopeptidase F [Lentilactobacillus sp. Marseille-Q4993]|uniref:oligoendopeptidase F n=1 Tax=Lentilactobacillus sp. Marseille-Q4993 TaxID=3039492 RepID=UPI0024BC43DB|nr:oligoendopeptidase F [Lentilactobacillus sp. Marseille-Q4993]